MNRIAYFKRALDQQIEIDRLMERHAKARRIEGRPTDCRVSAIACGRLRARCGTFQRALNPSLEISRVTGKKVPLEARMRPVAFGRDLRRLARRRELQIARPAQFDRDRERHLPARSRQRDARIDAGIGGKFGKQTRPERHDGLCSAPRHRNVLAQTLKVEIGSSNTA